MAYFDSIKIGGTIKQVQVVQELNALPSPVLETSPQLVKIGNDLYMRESKIGGAYGTYRFMLVPTNQQVYNVAFVSNGQTFGEIIINSYGEMTYNNTLVYSNGNWVNEKYKTIAIFDGNFTNALDSFLRNNTEKIIEGYFKYIKVSSDGGAGTTIIDITDLDEIPTQYQDAELLKTAILFDVDHLLRLTWIDDMYYYGNTDDFQYRYLSVDTNDFIIMRYDLQDIAKAPKIVNLNDFVPKTATQGTLERAALNVLQASNENYIVFNDEIFRLADKQHNAGYLVYSHNGHDTTGCFFQKCITITLSSRAWVLETQENQAKLTAGSNITIENNVISAIGGGSAPSENVLTIDVLYPEEAYREFYLLLNKCDFDGIVGVSSQSVYEQAYLDTPDTPITNEVLQNIKNGYYDKITFNIIITYNGQTIKSSHPLVLTKVISPSVVYDASGLPSATQGEAIYNFTLSNNNDSSFNIMNVYIYANVDEQYLELSLNVANISV